MSTTINTNLLGKQEPFGFDFASNYGYNVTSSVICGLILFLAGVPLAFFVSKSPVHRWTRLALLFYTLFQSTSLFTRAFCAYSARTNGSIFATAQSTDIVAFYELAAIVFNLDRNPKIYGDNRHAQLKQVTRWGGNAILFTVMILGFFGALVAGDNWVQRADQMMQSSAILMFVCLFMVLCLVMHSAFAPRFDYAASRVKHIDADFKAALVLLLITLALLIVSAYRAGAAFVPSLRVDLYYFSINFLLSCGAAVLLALSITAGQGGIEAKKKANEAPGILGRPVILDSNSTAFNDLNALSPKSPSKPNLTRAKSYNGPVVIPGNSVPVSAPWRQVSIALDGPSKPKMGAEPYTSSNNWRPPQQVTNSSSLWASPVDAEPVILNESFQMHHQSTILRTT